ncbi:hypothetical protein DVH24_033300 [Malus domestica]|uniref:Uncharacterized protein n=1 Tax=Malus domestica TaxID=3750 RepID=A0A498JEC1_MALDO|nr:hypothetical protein DVH24_033300 [Malus domestica]
MNKSKGSCLLSCKGVSQYACKLKFWKFLDRLSCQSSNYQGEWDLTSLLFSPHFLLPSPFLPPFLPSLPSVELRREVTEFDSKNRFHLGSGEGREQEVEETLERERATQWQWQSMVVNLQLAHQELSVIIDLINTVETNDVVTVASMTHPKLLPNEAMSDLAVNMENTVNAWDMENAESCSQAFPEAEVMW